MHANEPQISFLGLAVIPLLAIAALILAIRGMDAKERQIVLGALVAHIVGTFLLIFYHTEVYHGGDMYFYRFYGAEIGKLLRMSPREHLPEVVRMLVHSDNRLAIAIGGGGMKSTGTMCAISGLIAYVTGDSFHAIALPASIYSFLGQTALYRAIREFVDPKDRQITAVGALLTPSVVFWSSGVVKEAFAIAGLGFMCWGLVSLAKRARIVGLPMAAFGAVSVGLIKPYVLLPFVLAIGMWALVGRQRRFSLLQKLLLLLLAGGGLFAISRLFPTLAVDKIGETIAHEREMFMTGTRELDVGDYTERSLVGQLAFAPIALVNALGRPLFFDARNVTQFIASIEMTVVVYVALQMIWRHKARVVWREIMDTPLFAAAGIFIVTFGVGVGLSTTNLGSLSRYRLPMMPIYIACVLLLRARLEAKKQAEQPAAEKSPSASPALAAALARRDRRRARRALTLDAPSGTAELKAKGSA